MVEKKTWIEVWESVKLHILSLWIVTRGYHIIAPCSKPMLLCVGGAHVRRYLGCNYNRSTNLQHWKIYGLQILEDG